MCEGLLDQTSKENEKIVIVVSSKKLTIFYFFGWSISGYAFFDLLMTAPPNILKVILAGAIVIVLFPYAIYNSACIYKITISNIIIKRFFRSKTLSLERLVSLTLKKDYSGGSSSITLHFSSGEALGFHKLQENFTKILPTIKLLKSEIQIKSKSRWQL